MKRILSARCFCRWLIAVVLGCLPATALPDDSTTNAPPPPALTLDALVAGVVRDNPELEFYRAEIAAAQAGRRTAAQWTNPELSGDVGSKRVWERNGGATLGDGVAWSVAVSQSFEWPGRIALRKAIANGQVAAARLGLDQFQAALAARAGAGLRFPRRAGKGPGHGGGGPAVPVLARSAGAARPRRHHAAA